MYVRDISAAGKNFYKTGTYITDLSGVTITFNTGEEKSPDNDGFMTIPQDTTNFTVKRYGNEIGAMITFWLIGDPIAYSTTFEFTVPNDGNEEVWYYVLAMVYVPSTLSGENFYFVASADDSVQNVKLDQVSKAGSGSSVNVDLGSLSGGHHLLEFEFVEIADGGWLNFHVATSSGDHAWLVRYRIYVPNYSDTEYEYTVTTTTWTTMKDDYFLLGYCDDYLDDIQVDGTTWQDWEWNCTPYDTIYGWGDGFSIPLGNLENNTGLNPYDVGFKFGETWGPGLLDFQLISWSEQQDRIGPPRFHASNIITNIRNDITLNDAKFSGGSQWESAIDPGYSERKFDTRTSLDISYDDGTYWFDTQAELGLGNAWAEWGLSAGATDDIAITLNFTLNQFDSNRPTGQIGECVAWWQLGLVDYTIDTYSFENLRITGMQCDIEDSDGIIGPDWTVVADFTGGCVLLVATYIPGPWQYVAIGSLVGMSILGGSTMLKLKEDQEVSRYDQTITEDHHWQLQSTIGLGASTGLTKNSSDIVFLGLDPIAGRHCGLTKVVLKGTLEAAYGIYCYVGSPIYYDYPVADIEISICIPWFLWP